MLSCMPHLSTCQHANCVSVLLITLPLRRDAEHHGAATRRYTQPEDGAKNEDQQVGLGVDNLSGQRHNEVWDAKLFCIVLSRTESS